MMCILLTHNYMFFFNCNPNKLYRHFRNRMFYRYTVLPYHHSIKEFSLFYNILVFNVFVLLHYWTNIISILLRKTNLISLHNQPHKISTTQQLTQSDYSQDCQDRKNKKLTSFDIFLFVFISWSSNGKVTWSWTPDDINSIWCFIRILFKSFHLPVL